MEHKVSSYEERQLTNAIERAATVTSVNEALDPNTVLVQQLKKASVDPKFAETAARAFNKRLTVLNLRKTADEHKAEPFALADPDTVKDMLSGTITKAAAAQFAMTVEQLEDLDAEPMDKAASCRIPEVIVRDKRFEHLCSWDTFKERLESDMAKLASAFGNLQADLMNRENRIADEAKEVADYFKKAAYNFDFSTAVNLYGDKLEDAIGHLVDKGVSFKKTAKFVICPSKDIFKKVAQLISDKADYANVKWLAQELASGIAEFAKSAGALGDEYQTKQADLDAQIRGARQGIQGLDQTIKDVKDQLNQDATSGLMGARLGGAAGIVAGTAAGFGEGAVGAVNDITGAARTALNNAKALYYAGNNVSISPGDLLDAEFLTKDRYRDRLLAWSDMSADPQLSMYPAEQVFAATQKAMDMDTSMERPDQREVLRAQVAQLLAQNNRVSTADIAALAETLKALSEARSSAAVESAKAVAALSDKTEPGLVAQEGIVGNFNDTKGLSDLRSDASKAVEDSLKQLDAIGDKQRDALKDNLKELVTKRDRMQQALQKMLETKEKREFEQDQRDAEAKQKAIEHNSTSSIARSRGYTWIPVKGGKGFYRYTGKKNLNNVDPSYFTQPNGDMSLSAMEALAKDIRDFKETETTSDPDYTPTPPSPPSPPTPPTPPTPGPTPGPTPQPNPKPNPPTIATAQQNYPTEADRDGWAAKQQDWLDRTGLTFAEYAENLAQGGKDNNGNIWILKQEPSREFTFMTNSGGVTTASAQDLLDYMDAMIFTGGNNP